MSDLVPQTFCRILEERLNQELGKLNYDSVYAQVSPSTDIVEVFIMMRPDHEAPSSDKLQEMAFAVRQTLDEDYELSGGTILGQRIGNIHFSVKYPGADRV